MLPFFCKIFLRRGAALYGFQAAKNKDSVLPAIYCKNFSVVDMLTLEKFAEKSKSNKMGLKCSKWNY